MSEEADAIGGMSLEQWAAAYRPGMPEFVASTFVFAVENEGQVRLAFANFGPYVAPGRRSPVFTHAVTLSPKVALELGRELLKHFGDDAAA